MRSYLFCMLPTACALLTAAGAAEAKPARKTPPAATRAVHAANVAAVQEPKAGSFLNAVQVYTWSEGAVFRLFTAPDKVSDIVLQAGEELIAVSAGDTARWVIGDTVSGSGEGRQVHILVKPYATGLKTNLIITTTRRTYHVQLESTPATAMAAMAWRYPQDQILTRKIEAKAAPVTEPIVQVLPLETLSFGYVISGDRPAWRPERAFDDGNKVYIEFPVNLARTEAPPLFLVSEGGKTELVNYRVHGRFYVVDALFDKAELRLGTKRQAIVSIARTRDGKGWGGPHD